MIDWTKVQTLREEVGAEDFDEVVTLFLEEVEETLAQVGDAGRSLERDFHFLKGSALNLGFRQFSELCQTGEQAAANGVENIVGKADLAACYQSSKDQFMTEFPRRFGS